MREIASLEMVVQFQPYTIPPDTTPMYESVTFCLAKCCVTFQYSCCLCLQAVLGRWARQEEVVCGSATLGRNRPELKNLFGYFVDMLPLRTSLAGQQSFKELVSQMRQTFLEGLEHSDVPFGKLVEALNVPRTAAYSPVFQAICWLKEEAAIAHVEDFPSIGFHFLGRMVSLLPIPAVGSGMCILCQS